MCITPGGKEISGCAAREVVETQRTARHGGEAEEPEEDAKGDDCGKRAALDREAKARVRR